MKTISIENEYKNNIELIKNMYSVDHVVNYDQLALYSYFKRFNLDFHSFNRISDKIYSNGDIKVMAIDFCFYFKQFKIPVTLSGYNCNDVFYGDNSGFYDNKLNYIIPVDEEQREQISRAWEEKQKSESAWEKFNSIKDDLYKSDLGTRFDIDEPIYWYFLEVLPPIYGKDCFYCSEPLKHTEKGIPVYHCLRKHNNKFTIEENIIIK